MTQRIRGLSSMATKGVLAELSGVARSRLSVSVEFESAGGSEVAQRIRAGARADLAVLSDDVMSDLDAAGLLVAGTLRALYLSDVVAAVPDSAAAVPWSTEDDLRAALVGAERIAYSTGPSGTGLIDLIERWGLVEAVADKLVQARSGTPVGALLAGGRADLGLQQRSELSGIAGLRILGPLPGAAAIRSTFSGAVLARSTDPEAARKVLQFVGSKDVEAKIIAAGMTPA